jgi:hypothetical protein
LASEIAASLASPALHCGFLPREFLEATGFLGGASTLGAASREKLGRASEVAALLVPPERATAARLCSILWARAGVEGDLSCLFFEMPLVCDIRRGNSVWRGF